MHSLKAVVIDDDPGVLSFLHYFLKSRGYVVQTYENPADTPLHRSSVCPCSMEGQCPDLIISDLNMPSMSGVDLLEPFIKKGCRCRHIAMIAGKGFTEAELIRMAKFGTYYFTKPLDLDDFHAWLDRVEREVAESLPAST
jgi:DNA-binding response OmpR family regulator